MKHRLLAGAGIALCSVAAVLLSAPAISQGSQTQPARYTIDASTTSGMGAMAAGGGIGAAMGLLRGGGGQVAHELLHRGDRRAATTKKVRETEAEAVAFVVSQAIGLETNRAASDYIQLYAGSKETLLASLEAIRGTSVVLLDALMEDGRARTGLALRTA